MTVTPEQWAAVAAEIDITVRELRERVASLDSEAAARLSDRELFEPRYLDRDGDPLTLGEWAWLYESMTYKFVAETTLGNGYWVATIWHGVRDFDGDGTVLETSVFPAPPEENKRLVPAIERVTHPSMEDAVRSHAQLVAIYAHLDGPAVGRRRAANRQERS